MLLKLTTDCLVSSYCNLVVYRCYCEEFWPTDKWKWKHCKTCAKSWWHCQNWPLIVWSVHTVIWLSAIVTVKSFDLQISGSGNTASLMQSLGDVAETDHWLVSSSCNLAVRRRYCEEFRPADKWKWNLPALEIRQRFLLPWGSCGTRLRPADKWKWKLPALGIRQRFLLPWGSCGTRLIPPAAR